MKRLEEALKYIPLEEKLGLLEALRAAPHLVTRESDVTRFLVAAGGDTLAAARRLCRYWNERRRAYGPVLAFRALRVTASRPPDVHDDGRTCAVLPRGADAAAGGPVLYYDKTQPTNRALLHPQPDPCRARVLFYACQRLSEEGDEAAQGGPGVVLVLRVDPTETAQALRFHKAHLELGHYLAHVFPLTVRAWHIVARLERQQRGLDQTLWVRETLPVLVARWEAILGKPPAHIHAGHDEATLCASLRQWGILMDHLPRDGNSTLLSDAAAAAIGNVAAAMQHHQHNSSSSDHDNNNNQNGTTTVTLNAASLRRLQEQSTPGSPHAAATLPATGATATTPSSPSGRQQQQEQKASPAHGGGTPPSPAGSIQDWQRNTLQHAEGFGVLDDPEMRRQGLRQLADAVSFLPDHQTAAYRHAQRACPQLVTLESDPLRFLRFHRYNAWSAAQRITTYWNKRKEIFQQRAFLPMTMTGEGALNQQDITILRTGYLFFLPPDRDGRTVVCYDPSRRGQQHPTKDIRMRIAFYIWSLICENEACIRNGYVGIVLLGNESFGMSSLDGPIREGVDMVVDCFPTEAKNVHLVQIVRPVTAKRSLLKMALPLLLNVMGRVLEKAGVTHASESQAEMTQEFEPYGVSPTGLPVSAGGTWTHDEFYQWQLERCRVERERYDWSRYRTATSSSAADAVPSTAFSSAPSSSSSSQQQQKQQELMQVDYMVRRLGQGERAAYLEACAKSPTLIRDESHPSWFIAHAEGDQRAAARQLAAYWTLRKRLFGERAFLAMAQTGEGALGRKELVLLNSGFFTILPTKQNETVLVSYDCAKDDTTDEIGRLRVAFYTLSLAAERDISRSRGFVIIASGLKELARLQEEGNITSNISFESVLEALPIRVSAIHIAMLLHPGTVSYPLESTVQMMRSLFGIAGHSKGLVHVGTSRDEVAEQLVPYGIAKSILPRYLGGGFGYDRFTQWQELRIRYEWGLPAGANDRDAVEIYDFSKVKQLTDMTEEEKKERKRRMNVVHSRRKRERERIEIEVLQEQCDELRDRRVVLTEDTHRLEGLLRHAQALVNNTSAVAAEANVATTMAEEEDDDDDGEKPPAKKSRPSSQL